MCMYCTVYSKYLGCQAPSHRHGRRLTAGFPFGASGPLFLHICPLHIVLTYIVLCVDYGLMFATIPRVVGTDAATHARRSRRVPKMGCIPPLGLARHYHFTTSPYLPTVPTTRSSGHNHQPAPKAEPHVYKIEAAKFIEYYRAQCSCFVHPIPT